MGTTLSTEYPSVWDLDETKEWKKSAASNQRNFYLGFQGSQWDEYGSGQFDLVRTKICYSMYGPPTNEARTVEEAYTDEQRKTASVIVDKIYDVYRESRANVLRVGFIFISCFPEGKSEFIIPVFRVYDGVDENNGQISKYVDTDCRVYSNWNDWKYNNKLPLLKYCYPKRGFYTFTDDHVYNFDEHKEPCLEFGTSPACDLVGRIATTLDFTSSIGGLAGGGIAIASIFIGVAPILLTTSAIVGGVSATYGTGRSVQRLADKGTHGQSLGDLESVTCWVAIAAAPLSFASSVVNGSLAAGARVGTISSSSLRTTATVLNLARLGTDSTMLLFGLSNLIEKTRNDQLEVLDVLQFSMSVFFFGHTLVQPITANGIIKQAQQQHIDQYQQSMTAEDTKQAFKNFLERNGKGGIKDNSKIIRTLNRIDNPDGFFKGVGVENSVQIGGRKGKTVIIEGQHGTSNRVNPNRIEFEARPIRSIDFKLVKKRLAAATGQSPDGILLNGEPIFDGDLTEHQKQRLDTVFKSTARDYNADIISTSLTLAEELNANTADQLICVTESVACEIKGTRKADMTAILTELRGGRRREFLQSFKADMQKAMQIANDADLTFADPYKAVYHYRKHGNEFSKFCEASKQMNFYLGELPAKTCQDRNLTNINTLPSGMTLKTYMDPSTNAFAVVAEHQGVSKVATVFQNGRAVEDFNARMTTADANRVQQSKLNQQIRMKEDLITVTQNLANTLGFASIQINVTTKGKTAQLEEYINSDELNSDDSARLAIMLSAIA